MQYGRSQEAIDRLTTEQRLVLGTSSANATGETNNPIINKEGNRRWRFMALLLPCVVTGHSARIRDEGRWEIYAVGWSSFQPNYAGPPALNKLNSP